MACVESRSRSWKVLLCSASIVFCEACDVLLELDRFTLQSDAQVPLTCTSDAVCADAGEPSLCSLKLGQCVPVLSEGCVDLTGEYNKPDTLRLGAMLTLHGPQQAINRERQRGLQLAVEQINAAGGVQDARKGAAHPLALVTCDTGADPLRAARHLIEALGVPAILGPSSSEDTLRLATELSIAKRTLTMSPTAMASSLRDLADDDLSWLMVPTDEQRAPLMQAEVRWLEGQLERDRTKPLKLSIVYRDDAFGHGVRLSLKSLSINHKPLSHPDNQGNAVSIAMYDPSLRDVASLIAAQLAFKPDILVLAGGAEAVTEIMRPLEERLHATSSHRPQYVLTDASKVAELVELMREESDLSPRVHGIGLAHTDEPSWSAFEGAFRARFDDADPQLSGIAAAYDSVYALAFGAAATSGELDGPGLAAGLRALSAGPLQDASADLVQAFRGLSPGRGAVTSFSWDDRGAPERGKLSVWCVSADGFVSSDVRFELAADIEELQLTAAQGCGSKPDVPTQPTRPPATTHTAVQLGTPPSAADVAPDVDADAGVEEPEPDRPELYAEYRSANTNPNDSVIAPWLRVGNRGTGKGVPLDQLKLRYYVTNETNPLCLHDCVAELYWAGLMPEGTRVPAKVEYVPSGFLAGYLELTFMPDAPALRPREYTELQMQFHTSDYQPLDESNDYSFDAEHRDFAESRRVAVFRDDKLVWGDLPPW